ncbi:MAG: DUF4268 domain-containing protein [Chloroflexi bacterium]|nr:DUF4268 domain-containing protein [Chloroflexota bacterium]
MTNAQQLGKLVSVDPRKIWQHEAHDFTPWLAENLDLLGEELGLDLEIEDTESAVGDFFADITATESGRKAKVIVENQLVTTDHNHLGQLMTYASGQRADIVIWVATEFRDEHRQALDWLNQRTDDSLEFYGVTINVKRIGGSHPAPEFRPVAFPNAWQKATKTRERDISPRREKQRVFFQTLVDELRTNHGFTNAKTAHPQGWHWFSSGHAKIGYCAVFGEQSRVRVELYLDRDSEFNKQLFDSLNEKRAEIEQSLNETLGWERLDTRKSSRIALYTEGSIDSSERDLRELREWMVENLLKFKEVFSPYLADLV